MGAWGVVSTHNTMRVGHVWCVCGVPVACGVSKVCVVCVVCGMCEVRAHGTV